MPICLCNAVTLLSHYDTVEWSAAEIIDPQRQEYLPLELLLKKVAKPWFK